VGFIIGFTKSLLFVLFLAAATSSSRQVAGKTFNAEYANQNFGDVVSYIEIDNVELEYMHKNTGEYIMFNIYTISIKALDENRTSVHEKTDSENEVFYKLSTTVQVELLLEKGGYKITSMEMRPETLTLTNREYTLEMSDPCPPNCD